MCSRWTSTHIHEKSADILDVQYVDSYELVIVLQTNLLTVITTDQLVDCCKQYHSYNYNACTESEGGTNADPTATLYYPDWENNSGCIVGGAPDYMKLNPLVPWLNVARHTIHGLLIVILQIRTYPISGA